MGSLANRYAKGGGPRPRPARWKGPLRAIVRRLTYSTNIFDSERVELECGHITRSWGGMRARCRECGKKETK